ncbi:MAG: methyltransferase [Deltaproteobacteria bacterium]|jgi:16S rRNA A1518/A1519 N6-dimethyltransferase RsmA/KsgA/DIM1 with predicted DNA glycosylase/AP lyase activity|nr:methyltransferase [Deltaproteobacteria bacterium]
MAIPDKLSDRVEYGDYQTPLCFTRSVCEKLRHFYKFEPTIVIEPTFGTGNFIDSAKSVFPTAKLICGIELNPTYYKYGIKRFKSQKASNKITLYNSDIFSFDFSIIRKQLSDKDTILIIGNPPWVTNTQLSSMNSRNLPLKDNFKGCSGLDAITGKGNFDIAENIILKMLHYFDGFDCTLAMLCKTIVAKNIIRDMPKLKFNVTNADMFVFDARAVFNIICDAVLLVIKLGVGTATICDVYDYDTNQKISSFGWKNKCFYSDIAAGNALSFINGTCQVEWRQGIKHDCAKVMELTRNGHYFINGMGESVGLKIGKYLFPLVKSSDIKAHVISETRKYVIVPQRYVNSDTSKIKTQDKSLWNYLVRHVDLLDARRSIIYKKAPKFSIFGIGNYSFSKYKVGVSGFYKDPVFALLIGEHPIMMDDTCYFLSFGKMSDAIITTALLNSDECKTFLKSIAFLDSKRPYTKEVLGRIDLRRLHEILPFDYVRKFAHNMKGGYNITKVQYLSYLRNVR